MRYQIPWLLCLRRSAGHYRNHHQHDSNAKLSSTTTPFVDLDKEETFHLAFLDSRARCIMSGCVVCHKMFHHVKFTSDLSLSCSLSFPFCALCRWKDLLQTIHSRTANLDCCPSLQRLDCDQTHAKQERLSGRSLDSLPEFLAHRDTLLEVLW